MDHTGPDGHDTSENGSGPGIDGQPCIAPRQQGRTLLTVAAVGGATTVGAYALSGGSIPIFVAVMVAIGIVTRGESSHYPARTPATPWVVAVARFKKQYG